MKRSGEGPLRVLDLRGLEAEEAARRLRSLGENEVQERVQAIIDRVRQEGDRALLELTRELDGVDLEGKSLRVNTEEFRAASWQVPQSLVEALRAMRRRVEQVERRVVAALQPFTLKGEGLEARWVVEPVRRVGCYTPGGRAAYPSSLVMAVTAAQVAGVDEIVVVTPPGPGGRVNPSILVAADLCGIDEVDRVGGAQAIAALAYGTESIGRDNLIVGPGGRYVDVAKRLLYGVVAIDLPAGPTELLVVAGEGADPRLIAWDLISQAEHGEDAVCGLLTPSPRLAGQVVEVVAALIPNLERRELVEASFRGQGFIGLCRDVGHAVAVADAFAPEHLELLVGEEWAERVSSAGLVLLGPQTPPSLTDYGLGPNHILPTGGAARAFSPLSALTFLRHHFIVRADPQTLAELRGVLEPLARAEGLINHWRALEVRLDE